MRYSINVKYWHDSHDHELFFSSEIDARSVFRALHKIAVNIGNDVEFVSLWDGENLLECTYY